MTDLFDILLGTLQDAVETIRPLILLGSADGVVKNKSDGDTTRNIDIMVEEIFISKFSQLDYSMLIISEEAGIVRLSDHQKYVLFLDPIDGTDMAAHGYPLCSIAISLCDYMTKQPLISIIADIMQEKYYCAYEGSAFILCDGQKQIMRVAPYKKISDCMAVCYAAKPKRFLQLLTQKELFSRVGLFLNYGGPMDIAKVGAGSVDFFIEFQKGFKNIDYISGIHIAQSAGAIVSDLDGKDINLSFDIDMRQKLLASSNRIIHNEILSLLNR